MKGSYPKIINKTHYLNFSIAITIQLQNLKNNHSEKSLEKKIDHIK